MANPPGFTPSSEYLERQKRLRDSVHELERRKAEREQKAYEKRRAKLYRIGGVAGRNGVWEYQKKRRGPTDLGNERVVHVHVYPDERGDHLGWSAWCDCSAISARTCWHRTAAIERELEYLQAIREREGWGHEAVDAIAPLVPLHPRESLQPLEVEDLGGGRYRVASEEAPGVAYNVQVVGVLGVCDCPGFGGWGECKHIERVQELRNERAE